MTQEQFFQTIGIYIVANILLFVVERKTSARKDIHRILSVADNLAFALILGYGLYRVNHLFVILVAVVLLIAYPLAWGVNEELSDEEAASLVWLRSSVPLSDEMSGRIKLAFIHLATFPFYYLLKSWRKDKP